MSTVDAIKQAAHLLAEASGVLITAGAGMGVDSGLPDFRGTQGFWRAYPALGKVRMAFEEIANPQAFLDDPGLAWGFYGHRLALYRATVPHAGFSLLRSWAGRMAQGGFVFTSNVDGQFQKAGFDPSRICEIHGSIHHLQCLAACTDKIWSAANFVPEIDVDRCRLLGEMPSCPHCGGLARPNILMFGDAHWIARRQQAQLQALENWLLTVDRLLVIEIGAGTTIPTVRRLGEQMNGSLIRINRDAPQVPAGPHVGLAMNGLEALRQIAAELGADPA